MEQNNKNIWTLLVSVFLVVVAITIIIYVTSSRNGEENIIEIPQEETIDPEVAEKIKAKKNADRKIYDYMGLLNDVTDGEVVLGVDTLGNAVGFVQTDYTNGIYSLYATFDALPNPEEGTYYEGWIIRTDPLDVISVGKVEKIDGTYTNLFAIDKDLTDHTLYVLTVEPDDGDPDPAEHILEGTITQSK